MKDKTDFNQIGCWVAYAGFVLGTTCAYALGKEPGIGMFWAIILIVMAFKVMDD